jgi:hypothetical protein
MLTDILATSIHSRAAKRASSPSIDTDKSLKNIKPPSESTNYRPSVLAVHQGAGVTKKSKNGRKSVLSAKAKRRQDKLGDMAEAVMDKKVTRIEKSKGRARNTQDRSKAWEEHNRKILAEKARIEALALEQENWVDDNEDSTEELDDAPVVVATVLDVEGDDSNLTDAPPLIEDKPATDEASKDVDFGIL